MDVQSIILLITSLPQKIKEFIDLLKQTNQRLDAIEQHLYQNNQSDFLNDLVPLEELLRRMSMSKRKWFYLRDRGELDYVQIGKHLYMTRQQIEDFIKKFSIINNNQ